MPAAGARRIATQSPERPGRLDLNKLGGEPGAAEIKKRVREWQQTRPIANPIDDAVIVEYEPESPTKSHGSRSGIILDDPEVLRRGVGYETDGHGKATGIVLVKPARTPEKTPVRRGSTELDVDKKAWVRRKSKAQHDVVAEVKHAGQPKKRVVSDGHWRKDKTAAKVDSPVASPLLKKEPEKVLVKKSVEQLGRKASPAQPRNVDRSIEGWRQEISPFISPSKDLEEEDKGYKIVRRSPPVKAKARERVSTSPVKAPRPKWETFDPAVRRTPNRRVSDRRSFDSDEMLKVEQAERPQSSGRTRRRRERRSFTPPSESEFDAKDSVASPIPDDSISRRNATTGRVAQSANRVPLTQRRAPSPATTPPKKKSPLSRRPSDGERQYQKAVTVEAPRVPPAPPPVFANRIDAWLTSTPDPFKDTPSQAGVIYQDQGEDKKVALTNNDSSAYRIVSRIFNKEQSESETRTSPRQLDGSKKDPSPETDRTTLSPGDHSPTTRTYNLKDPSSTDGPEGTRQKVAFSDVQSDATYLDEHSKDNSPVGDRQKPSLGFNLRRHFPTRGKALSTIVSVETSHTEVPHAKLTASVPENLQVQQLAPLTEGVCTSETGSGLSQSKPTGLKRRLTRHDDLISVLSLPRADAHSLVSARSIRTHRTRLEDATMEQLLDEISTDEMKYQRELRTLVDGVVPVLLSSVLSKADSGKTAGLFGAKSQTAITQPIVDMGIALERLKASHRRMPQRDPVAILTWAQNASRIYQDYLKAWRLGFQDVIVNLAPVDPAQVKAEHWDDGIPRNDKGDLLTGDGERVDVAFLLKRPLVRLKSFARTFKGINHLQPSAQAATIADLYQGLVEKARKRSNEEHARLEDEAAAAIDVKRARDPQSLAPLVGVKIDPSFCVRARDYFDMQLRHSSGQQLDCRIEVLIRDSPSSSSAIGGDLLFCEVSSTGRWLLFPPILQSMTSARGSKTAGQLAVMIRGLHADGREWSETLNLATSEPQACDEWLSMLKKDPLPPTLSRSTSFAQPPTNDSPTKKAMLPGAGAGGMVMKSRTPSPKEIEVPIGECARATSKRWSQNIRPAVGDPYGKASRASRSPVRKAVPAMSYADYYADQQPEGNSGPTQHASMPDLYGAKQEPGLPLPDGPSSPGTLKRTKARRYRDSPRTPSSPLTSRDAYFDQDDQLYRKDREQQRPALGQSRPTSSSFATDSTVSTGKDYSVWLPSSAQVSDESESDDEYDDRGRVVGGRGHKRTSSVPLVGLFSMPKLRLSSQPSTPKRLERQMRHESEPLPDRVAEDPASAPAKLQKRQISGEKSAESKTPTKNKLGFLPSLTPKFMKRPQRPSSPLKHEYAPSDDSASSELTDASDVDYDEDDSVTSESDYGGDDYTIPKTPALASIDALNTKTPPESLASLAPRSLAPSNSASQGPYRGVPQQARTDKTVATIFAWSEKGVWESLHPQECTVIITPGLIEAFDVSAAHSVPLLSDSSKDVSPSAHGVKPLVALELTPLVPLRRGTALDISIRSPPTENSLIRRSNNVMFRSRSPEECESLYYMINHSRINNPTFIALQNARGPSTEGGSWAAAMDRRNAARMSSTPSWWRAGSRRGSTYRSTGSRPASIAISESSVGTMSSAMSALKRFSGGPRIFNLSKSTVTSRVGDASTNTESLSSGASTPRIPSIDPLLGTPLGVSNLKIRLYLRESASKWRDMGSARLTIVLPTRGGPMSTPSSPAAALSTSFSPGLTGTASPPLRPLSMGAAPLSTDKRVVVKGATKGEMLLDVTLGESCFERVARTGIAVSVWEETKGADGQASVGAVGGVLASRAKVYMIQLKSERDCAYTFGLVGKLRY